MQHSTHPETRCSLAVGDGTIRLVDTENLSVAMVTAGRCPELLRFLVERWTSLGAEVSLSGATDVLPGSRSRLVCTPFSTSPWHHGACFQAAIDAATRPYVLVSADDILPVDDDAWRHRLPTVPNAIQSIRLVSVLGQRWGDWAYYNGSFVANQAYDERRPGTYITGGSQLVGPEVRKAIKYRGVYRQGADLNYCYAAEAAGFELRPPVKDGPLLIHLDRWPNAPQDPERLHIPLCK